MAGGMPVAINGKIDCRVELAANFGATNADFIFGKARKCMTITAASITDRVGQATQAANSLTWAIIKKAASGGTVTVIASTHNNTTGGAALAAAVPTEYTIDTTKNDITNGDYYGVRITPATGTSAAQEVFFDIEFGYELSQNKGN